MAGSQFHDFRRLQLKMERTFFCCCMLLLSGGLAANAAELRLSAGDIDYPAGTTVVTIALPSGKQPQSKSIALTSPSGERVIAQRDSGDSSLASWILESPLAARETRTYQIDGPTQNVSDVVTCDQRDDDYVIHVQGKPVLQYNATLKECPVPGFTECRRSGFIHPLYAPSGTVVSDDFPPEHAHQHGIMFAWVDTEFRGRVIDFWNSMKKLGITKHVETLGCSSGPVFAELRVRIRHEALSKDGENQAALDEIWRVRVYNSVEPFIIDIESVQTCASDAPLKIRQYHYGGMAFRGARQWSFGKATFLTSLGDNRESGNHTRPLWTAITGKIDGRDYTFCGMGHPANFRHPQPVRLHPDMPYFCWAPEVLGEFELIPGEPYRSEYCFYVTDGPPDKAEFDDLQQVLASPLGGNVLE